LKPAWFSNPSFKVQKDGPAKVREISVMSLAMKNMYFIATPVSFYKALFSEMIRRPFPMKDVANQLILVLFLECLFVLGHE
jgi:hypothetical protein